MSQLSESKGCVLFTKKHREKDMLVKIFTESAGKQMFYVRGAYRPNNPLSGSLQPFTQATYIGKFQSEGLSFLNNAKDVHVYRHIQSDIFATAYGTYLLNLVDAAIEDRVYDPNLYTFLNQALLMLDQGNDSEIITNIFEVQILQRFGVSPNWQHCAVCGTTTGKFDYSSKYNGVLCEHHWSNDPRRYHADPTAIHFLRIFAQITYQQVQSIELKSETKKAIRATLDQLYDEYVGIALKSKKFIDQMASWENILLQPSIDNE